MFKRSLYAMLGLGVFLTVAERSHAAVCTALTASPSQATVQNALNSCGAGNSVQLAAGVTTVTSTIAIPCGVMLVGPTATPATAEFTTSASGYLFNTPGACSSTANTGISYLHANGGDVFDIDANNHSNIVMTHNQFTAIPQNPAVQFEQGNGNTINGVTIEYNTIGDANSCTAVQTQDTGGCGVEFFSETPYGSHMVNMVMKYNSFNHVNEASHFYGSCYYANCNSGPVNTNVVNTCDNCDIEYNFFTLNHRITLEYQMQMINHPLIISNNVLMTALNGYYGTYFISTPCCQFGSTIGSSTISPASIEQNNILIVGTTGQTSGCGSGSPCDEAEWGFEFWGNGSQATNNLVQGLFCVGYQVGYPGNTAPVVQYNTIEGSLMNGGNCVTYRGTGGYIEAEYSNYFGATVSPNTTGSTTASVQSVAPTISPASGNVNFPLTVTLTDPGYTSPTGSSYPNGNTGVWYTTDGSNPVPGSGTAHYAATGSTITLSSAGTVKAVGMWGTPPQPTSYPSGYGFTPSAVVSATYSGGGGGGGGTVAFGDTTDNTAGATYPNAFNDVYAITGINPAGYTVNTGTVCIAPGTVTNGANIDIGINSAPTATTESTTALCHATYTNTSNTSPGCVTVPLNGCGLLASDRAYWLWTITNDPLGPSPLYFSNCGGACNGAAPTSPGVGTYAGFYLQAPYGSYGAMSSTFSGRNTDQPSVYLGVTPAVEYGVTTTSVNDKTSQNYFNDVYAITGSSSGGYTVNAGTVCIAPGTVTNGAKTDIGINTAPTSTTEGATALCHATYTNTSSTSPGCVTVPLTGCGTLSANTPYWLWTITNDPIQGSPLYFSNCGGTCNGTAPTSAGVGTYGGYYLHGTYGIYTGMSSAFTGGPSPAQPSVSLSVTPH